ncbi:MAG: Fatty acid hydroxylase superfamily protein [Solirubrobacterales bacterium]|jgi:sterol desaturase/sphingolipid hydroxylase (fatty acid hydroxylase superfamily)|nr:Fatty acid hydroxylase superfamily protein [Solirubrobacterales bacterium]
MGDVASTDRYTAPADAVRTARSDGPARLADCLREFLRQPSPPYLLGAVAVLLALRIAQGNWSWRDAVMALGLLAATPFVEWAIHVYLLHAGPIELRGRRIEMLTAREHRAHHESPAVLDGVLLPVYGVLVFLAMIAAVNWLVSFPIAVLLGGPRMAYATGGVLVSYAILAAYEWTHFLIHAPYRPRGRYFKAIWRNHRLHHFKNERYWFGVTSTIGDRVIGTLPDQSSVPRSATARSLRS